MKQHRVLAPIVALMIGFVSVSSYAQPEEPKGNLEHQEERREKDTWPQAFKKLREQFPHATLKELGRLYGEKTGKYFDDSTVSVALRQAGVWTKEEQQKEFEERPKLIAAKFRTMTNPTRDALADWYWDEHGVRLARNLISEALKKEGIHFIEPKRKPDLEEVAARPELVLALSKKYPKADYDELGRLYETEYPQYARRLTTSDVGAALKRFGLHRHRPVDPNELKGRDEKVLAIYREHNDWSNAQIAAAYKEADLSPSEVHGILRKHGITRTRPIDENERKTRDANVKKLRKDNPNLSYDQLGQLYYDKGFGPVLAGEEVSRIFASQGDYRRRPLDPEEVRLRGPRLKALHEEDPKRTYDQLRDLYYERHQRKGDTKLSKTAITTALNQQGIYHFGPRQPKEGQATFAKQPSSIRRVNREELQVRPQRVRELAEENPRKSYRELALIYNEECRLKGYDPPVEIFGSTVQAILASQGIRRR